MHSPDVSVEPDELPKSQTCYRHHNQNPAEDIFQHPDYRIIIEHNKPLKFENVFNYFTRAFAERQTLRLNVLGSPSLRQVAFGCTQQLSVNALTTIFQTLRPIASRPLLRLKKE